MSQVTDGQDASVVNAKVDAAAIGSTGSTAPAAGVIAVTSPVFVTATARQVNANAPVYLYIDVNTAAALKIEMGPTSAVANIIQASESAAIGLLTLRVPTGWYVKLTGTMANLTVTAVGV